MGELRFRTPRVLVGLPVKEKPQSQPGKPERTGYHEGPAPAKMFGDPGD